MPVRNEERHLADSVARVLDQEYAGGFELLLAVGPSKDRTEEIAWQLAAADPRITVVQNPSGKIASAMNAASRPSSTALPCSARARIWASSRRSIEWSVSARRAYSSPTVAAAANPANAASVGSPGASPANAASVGSR